jgi:hypothetical protein
MNGVAIFSQIPFVAAESINCLNLPASVLITDVLINTQLCSMGEYLFYFLFIFQKKYFHEHKFIIK